MGLRFVCLSIMLRLFFLSYLMTTFSSIEAYVYLGEQRWTVTKDDVLLNVTAPKVNVDTSDLSNPYRQEPVKESIPEPTKNVHTESRVTSPKKNRSLLSCTNITLKKGEYDIYKNGTLRVKAFRMTLNSSSYIQNGDLVTICKPKKKEIEFSPFVKAVLVILTFTYSLITMLSALCSFSKNSTYLKLALVSWICVSSNIFIWIIVILIIPGPQSLFSWVSLSVNMNQSVYLTSAWMSLLTSDRALRLLQKYSLIEISKYIVTVKVGPLGILCVIMAAIFSALNFLFDKIFFIGDEVLFDCLFCNPITYMTVTIMVIAETFHASCQKNLSEVSRNYASYHISLCKFTIFNFYCICVGTISVICNWHFFLWTYTMLNFLWPLYFIKNIIPRIQTFMALASDDCELDDMAAEKLIKPFKMRYPKM